MSSAWVKAAGNPAADRWLTRTDCRTVLAVVPHMTAGTRLTDLLPLLEADYRVQVLCTVPDVPDGWSGVEQYVRGWGGVVLPWQQVLRLRFDLALAASYGQLDAVPAPALVVPHGVGTRSRRSPWTAGRDTVVRDGRVVPASVVVSHESAAARLTAQHPEVASRVVVGGDPCFDRLRASAPFRDRYRAALGVREGQELVVVSSTWSPHSLLGADADVLGRILAELPECRVVAAVHPNVWAAHGALQLRAWLADHTRTGLGLLPPEEGWRAALVAADYLIGDHGSVTQYGAALGVPTLLTESSAADTVPGSTADGLRGLVPTLDTRRPVRDQLGAAAACAERATSLAGRITSKPGRAAEILRGTMYRLLELPEPARALPSNPVPLPRLLTGPAGEPGPW